VPEPERDLPGGVGLQAFIGQCWAGGVRAPLFQSLAVSRSVEFLFGLTLAAGPVVLFAAVTAMRGSAVMRTLGAGSRRPTRVQRAELLAGW